MPWKQSTVTPNFGNSPDQTDDMRGGMAWQGVANCRSLSRTVDCSSRSVTASHADRLRHHDRRFDSRRRQLQARGSIYNAVFADRKSPIAYGYDEVPSTSTSRRLLKLVAVGGGGFGGGGGGQGQVSVEPIVRAAAADGGPGHSARPQARLPNSSYSTRCRGSR